jgi:hypothetical protein
LLAFSKPCNDSQRWGQLTIVKVPRLHQSRANTQKQHTLLRILGTELSHRHIHRRLANGVRPVFEDVVLAGHFPIAHTTGYGNDLLRVTLEDERQEEVEEVDVSDDVDLEELDEVGLEFGCVFFAPVRLC